MYPSLVTEDSQVVRLLKSGCEAMLGEAPETFYGQSAHDQGYLNAVGIQTANFGSGEQAFAQPARRGIPVGELFVRDQLASHAHTRKWSRHVETVPAAQPPCGGELAPDQ